ncbi:hypothetical protein [Merismopedia glauca]|uniref:hypothetical protein n=1 Tax=Merismopedia glauca TaxID=292586 RepID=UPI0030DBDA84
MGTTMIVELSLVASATSAVFGGLLSLLSDNRRLRSAIRLSASKPVNLFDLHLISI